MTLGAEVSGRSMHSLLLRPPGFPSVSINVLSLVAVGEAGGVRACKWDRNITRFHSCCALRALGGAVEPSHLSLLAGNQRGRCSSTACFHYELLDRCALGDLRFTFLGWFESLLHCRGPHRAICLRFEFIFQ